MRPRLFPFVTPLSILPLLGFQTIIGAEFDSATLAPSKTSCQPARPPVRPAHLPSAADSVDFTVVIDQLDFGDMTPESGKSRPVGYD